MALPKLITSDIDGTLIPYGEYEMPEQLFPLVRRLLDRGVAFCPASGRQFHSLRKLFAPVAEELCFLCENGAVIFGPGREEEAPVLFKSVMPRPQAVALAGDIMAQPGCDVLVSGERTCYVCRCGEALVRDLRDRLDNLVTRVDRIEDIGEEIIKVSAFCPAGTAGPKAVLEPRWGGVFQMAVAGPDWIDFTLSDKGKGLLGLCAALGIAPEEVMAFGDNWNDVPMLSLAGQPYLMSSAAPDLRERFPRQCGSVLTVLEELLDKE